MQDWLKAFHGANPTFPATDIAVKILLSLAVGLLVGLEREWSNKDIGVRTFSIAALLGLFGAVLGPAVLLLAGTSVLILIIFANLRGVLGARKLEATTSLALMVVFLLGVLVGRGHLFTPVASAIVVAMLLALKPQLHAFAGGLRQQELRSALVLGLLGFVIWPILPDRFIDPWQLIKPREAWITVVVIACLGFLNYVLLRVYGSKGIYLTAILGGLVNSTASVVELSSTLAGTTLVSLIVPVVKLTSIAMFVRNILLLAIFARGAVRTAALPILAMSAVAAFWIFRRRHQVENMEEEVSLTLSSPVSLRKVLQFGLIFLTVQILATLGQRFIGGAGFEIVSGLGGLVSSASATAAAANMAVHGRVTAVQAGTAAVLASMASALVNLPLVHRQAKSSAITREMATCTLLQVAVGIVVLLLQTRVVGNR